MEALQIEEYYTYADYCDWSDEERWELIDGVPYSMVPGSSQAHQTVSGSLFYQLYNYLEGKPCKVIAAPFDVRLNASTYDDTVVQPDILVVCDDDKLDGKSCVGAPDLIIEILSPATALKDKTIKFNVYQEAGVREYWIVDPEGKTVSANTLENGRYNDVSYTAADKAPVHVLEGCFVDLEKVFGG